MIWQVYLVLINKINSIKEKTSSLFFLLWIGIVCIVFFSLFLLRNSFYNIEQEEVYNFINRVIHSLKSNDKTIFFKNSELIFLRIMQNNNEMLMINSSKKTIQFSSLIQLPPERNGVWIITLEESPVLTIASKKIGNTLIQVGKDSSNSYFLYKKIYHYCIFTICFIGILFYLLYLFVKKAFAAPLIEVRQRVARLANYSPLENNEIPLLSESNSNAEFNALCIEINQLFLRNRHLTKEIQHSLDNVAHDIRTPMTRLRSVAEYGLREDNPERLQDALSDCLEEAEHVLSMLSVMMSVAEAETGTLRLNKSSLNICESIERATTLYEYVAEERNIAIIFNDTRMYLTPFFITVDKTRIIQVWANIIDNAIKYSDKNKQNRWIKITVLYQTNEVVIYFHDNGIGISFTEQKRIWERLYRGDRSRSEQGLGLGLNYAKAVIEAHGGSIVVESTLQKETKFIVRLPAESVK